MLCCTCLETRRQKFASISKAKRIIGKADTKILMLESIIKKDRRVNGLNLIWAQQRILVNNDIDKIS